MIARIRAVQKLKQKSQSNNCDMSFGALAITLSRIPNFPISKIKKAVTNAICKVITIKCISDIIL